MCKTPKWWWDPCSLLGLCACEELWWSTRAWNSCSYYHMYIKMSKTGEINRNDPSISAWNIMHLVVWFRLFTQCEAPPATAVRKKTATSFQQLFRNRFQQFSVQFSSEFFWGIQKRGKILTNQWDRKNSILVVKFHSICVYILPYTMMLFVQIYS